MNVEIKNLFRAQYGVPNGLQMTDDGLWIADQVTDRCALMDISEVDGDYGVTKLIKEIPSESSNTSGLTYGDGLLWFGVNGAGGRWRTVRETDAEHGETLGVCPDTGDTKRREKIPGGGGTHGVEYDPFEPGTLWIQTLKSQIAHQVKIEDWSILRTVQLPHGRGHGMIRVEDGLWVTHTGERVIVKLDVDTSEEMDRIEVPEPHPEPHGLTRWTDSSWLYCDAASGWVTEIKLG
jgi:glutamine cyclotransferase